MLSLPLGIFLAALTPLGQIPDEPPHVMKADSLLHGELIGHRETQIRPDGRRILREGVIGDSALLDVIISQIRVNDLTPSHMSGAALEESRRVRFGGRHAFYEIGTIASYFPIFYIPAAVAIGICKLCGFGAYAAFMAARLINLVLTLCMGAAALSLATRGRALLFATLLLPTTLSLAASVNQDGLLIGAAVLAVAFASRLRLDQPPAASPSYWAVAILVACISLAKPPYLPLVILLFLPLKLSRRSPLPAWFGIRLGTVALILACTIGWTWLNVHYAAAPVIRAPEEAGPLWPGNRPAIFDRTDMGAQLSVLLARPWLFISLPIHSMFMNRDVFTQLLGVLGWLNLVLPTTLMTLWVVALGASCLAGTLAGASNTDGSQPQETLALLAAVFITILLIYISQYLSFTPVGYDWISGPQGRYLVPLIPLVALALPRFGPRDAGQPGILLIPTAVAGLAGLYLIPVAIVTFFYHGQ
nr:DUF2142 domain-containing protein [Lichenicola cladoniae]